MVSDYTRPPVTQATLKGAPSVTVSPVGLAQGLPRNNNANFGPDTPGTRTCGIQEAINYVKSLAVPPIQLGFSATYPFFVRLIGNSVFNVYTTIDDSAGVPLEGNGAQIQAASPFTPITVINGITIPAAVLTCVSTGINLNGSDLFSNLVVGTNGIAAVNTTVYIRNVQKGVLRNLVLSATFNALQLYSCNGMNIYSPIIRLANQYGYQDNGNANHIYGGWISRCNQSGGYAGVLLNGAQQITFDGTVIQYNSVEIALSGSCNDIVFKGVWIEDLSTTGNSGIITTDTTIKNSVLLDSCYFVGAIPILANVDYIDGFTVRDCFRYNSGTATLTVGNNSSNSIIRGGSLPEVTFTLPSPSLITEVITYNPKGFSATIPTNPPVSGTTYQNTLPVEVDIYIPITYNPTATSPAQANGYISPVSPITASPVETNNVPAGLTTEAGLIRTMKLTVPPGWYWAVQVSNATIGTAVPVGK